MTDQVSPNQGMAPDSEMSLIGYVIAAGVGLILLPVLPFIAVLWLLQRAGDRGRRGARPG
ncbi:hypothetical protein BRC82_06205 [Halobacteriales archaeon QS_1_67_19]|nr:MAG: hypothetical protein BRC82_06205 [Halobacteriales archaeon QS_1_67_19]